MVKSNLISDEEREELIKQGYTDEQINYVISRKKYADYRNEYTKKSYDRVSVTFPRNEVLPKLKALSFYTGESVNSIINYAVNNTVDKMIKKEEISKEDIDRFLKEKN